ncbi:hypothetical protein [Nisaea nitritireducens]|uniref:hypothetical protein n=1 Tax=Nisaea nitritireducens TaxID=568392 RepID=UPI001D01CE6A|nr:hypothetical protein [Nisaea nitritireducens]
MSDAAQNVTQTISLPPETDKRFAILRKCRRIWAIASIHGDVERLAALHNGLTDRYEAGDRFVYLGNYYGHGQAVLETVDELLRFRRILLAQPPYTHLEDIVYLRGRQEEMWRKMLQLQFAGDCQEILDWMLERGADTTLAAYGGRAADARAAIMEGLLAVSRWTGTLRQAIRGHAGHHDFMTGFRRAAYTDDGALLFVSAGLDPSRDLTEQEDGFWWNSQDFAEIAASGYRDFTRLVRGYDPAREGIVEHEMALSIDGGAGFGGPLNAVCLDAAGHIVDQISA